MTENSVEEFDKKNWPTSDFYDQARETAANAVVQSLMCNRFFVLHVEDRFELIFGNFRSLGPIDPATPAAFSVQGAVSLDRQTAQVLSDVLAKVLAKGKSDEPPPPEPGEPESNGKSE